MDKRIPNAAIIIIIIIVILRLIINLHIVLNLLRFFTAFDDAVV